LQDHHFNNFNGLGRLLAQISVTVPLAHSLLVI
jgi:hypothetical protein